MTFAIGRRNLGPNEVTTGDQGAFVMLGRTVSWIASIVGADARPERVCGVSRDRLAALEPPTPRVLPHGARWGPSGVGWAFWSLIAPLNWRAYMSFSCRLSSSLIRPSSIQVFGYLAIVPIAKTTPPCG